MKKLKLRKWVKYLILSIIDGIIMWNLPKIIVDSNTLNEYRYNIIVLFIIIIFNLIGIIIAEKK